MKLMPDGKSTQVSFEIYKGKNSLGNDSIIELHIANVKNSFVGGVKVFSYYNKENAHANYYGLNGQILEEGNYYAPKRIYSLLKRYSLEESQVRLKSGSESNDPCSTTNWISNTGTPYEDNPYAYNCHAYVWGFLSSDNPYYQSDHPYWNDYPDIAGSGYSQVSTPQVGDRWVSYSYVSGFGSIALHSAFVVEVINGKVTKVRAKCGDANLCVYNPDCSDFSGYMTDDVRYYR
jgi:hypothetical protein